MFVTIVVVVLVGMGGIIEARLPFWLKRVSFFPPTHPTIYFTLLLLLLLCVLCCLVVPLALPQGL